MTFGTFAIIAARLTALGIGGVFAQSVGYRTREIGIRRALGATGEPVRRLVMSQTIKPVLVGMLIGKQTGNIHRLRRRYQ